MQDQGNLTAWLALFAGAPVSLLLIVQIAVKAWNDRKQKKLEGDQEYKKTQLEGENDIRGIFASQINELHAQQKDLMKIQREEFERQLEAQRVQMERELEHTNSRVESLEKELKKSEVNRKEQQVYFEEVIEKKEVIIENLEIELSEKETKLDRLKDVERKLKEATDHNERLTKQNNDFHWEVVKLEDVIDKLKKTISNLQQRLGILKEGEINED